MGRAIIAVVIVGMVLCGAVWLFAEESNAGSAELRLGEAKRLINIGKLDEAIAICKEPAVASLGIEARECLVKALVVGGRNEGAISELDKMVTTCRDVPEIAKSVSKLAGIYRGAGMKDNAFQILDLATAKLSGVNRLRVMADAVCLHIGEGEDGKAKAMIEVMKNEAKGNPEAALCLMPVATKYMDCMDTPNSAELFGWIKYQQGGGGAIVQSVAAKAFFYVDLCDILLAVGTDGYDSTIAMTELCNKYKGWPELPNAMLRLGGECWKRGCLAGNKVLFSQGAQICETIIMQYPQWKGLRKVYYIGADCRSSIGDHDRALELLQEALDKYPGQHQCGATQWEMGKAYEKAGDDVKASRAYIKASNIDPNSGDMWQCLLAAKLCFERLVQNGKMSEEDADGAVRGCCERVLDYSTCPAGVKATIEQWLQAHPINRFSDSGGRLELTGRIPSYAALVASGARVLTVDEMRSILGVGEQCTGSGTAITCSCRHTSDGHYHECSVTATETYCQRTLTGTCPKNNGSAASRGATYESSAQEPGRRCDDKTYCPVQNEKGVRVLNEDSPCFVIYAKCK